MLRILFWSLVALVGFVGAGLAGAAEPVWIVTDAKPGLAASHGIEKVSEALRAKGLAVKMAVAAPEKAGALVIVAGLAKADAGPAAQLLREGGAAAPMEAEALLIRRLAPARLLVCGADDRGLMYGLLDVADRIGWASDPAQPFSEVGDTIEKPDVVDRALSIYTMQQRYFEGRLHDAAYWDRYFSMLARHRFNRFVVIFGYENGGYMAPPYPYFFDVPGYPNVRVGGLSPAGQKRNLDALNRWIDQAHAHGLEFTIGIWDHIYRGGVQTGGVRGEKVAPGSLVQGVTGDNLMPFSVAALRQLFKSVPKFDSIQFRMHGESGLKRSEFNAFWKRIYQVVLDERPDIRFDARAKNFPHELIDLALDMGVDMRIATKYWMEQMGLPFHPTHVHPSNQKDRRHGYADMLRYPKRYKMHWRLWNGGTNRILLWGDPDYARRFAASTHLYDGEGFEVNEPLATKMEAQPHDMEPFQLLNEKYRYYDDEFERYWHFYQVFGRLGYNPNTPPEVWQREFERRFGKEAAPHVEAALHQASKILPRIVAYCYPYGYFPTTRGWAERQRMLDLPEFAKSIGSDTEQFLSPDEAARLHLAGEYSGKMHPIRSGAWFFKAADATRKLADRAERAAGDRANRELRSTLVDLRILAALARYHHWRINAAYEYALYKRSGDVTRLAAAVDLEGKAVLFWRLVVQMAGDVYYDDLMMGLRRSDLAGHWRDEVDDLEAGLIKLKQEQEKFRPDAKCPIVHVPGRKGVQGPDVVIDVTIDSGVIASARLVSSVKGGKPERQAMHEYAPYCWRAFLRNVPGISYYIEATRKDGKKVLFPSDSEERPISLVVAKAGQEDYDPPTVRHTRVKTAPAGKPLRITATVTDPAGVMWVRLRYRSVTQFEDYRTLEMKPVGGDKYEAMVPGEHVDPKWDFMYFIEAVDEVGNGCIHPDLEKEAPYVVVELER